MTNMTLLMVSSSQSSIPTSGGSMIEGVFVGGKGGSSFARRSCSFLRVWKVVSLCGRGGGGAVTSGFGGAGALFDSFARRFART